MQTGSRRAQICARRWTPSSHAARSQEPWTSSKQITARCSLKQDLRSRLSAAVILAHSPAPAFRAIWARYRSEEHTSELQSLMRISYAVFCLKKKIKQTQTTKYQK